MGSRIATKAIEIPQGVEVKANGQNLSVKGKLGQMSLDVHSVVKINLAEGTLQFQPANDAAIAMTGTMRSLANNMIEGVSKGFERKLELVGVGYRAQVQGKVLDLSLGFSHPVKVELPEGITAETPSQTEVLLKGVDKQKVNQVAANIRSIRPPEPYKGKGVRYAGEHIIRKEGKKK